MFPSSQEGSKWQTLRRLELHFHRRAGNVPQRACLARRLDEALSSALSISCPCRAGGARVNACIDLLTTTGRMVTSNPPLQNLDHKIRLTRSWRLSLAEEIEAEVPDIEVGRALCPT